MNPDQEMQAEAMDEAQDEILRLQEALAVEKGAHVETAKALVACRKTLMHIKDTLTWSKDESTMICNALSHTAGDDYVSKASVRPIVEALSRGHAAIWDAYYGNGIDLAYVRNVNREMMDALDQAKLLGLV